jgi:hypothetical protein
MGKFSKGEKIFIVMTTLVIGLLLYANCIAFNLISVPVFVFDIIAYVALAAAVALTLTIVIMDKRKGLFVKIQEPSAIDAVKETNVTTDEVPSPTILQNTTNIVEADVEEQKNQSVIQLVTEPTKLFCPACRKEFTLGVFEGDYMVNFGPPKPSNIIRYCPHCDSPIALKRKGSVEEEPWSDFE